ARPTPGVLGAGRRVGVRAVPTAGGGPSRSGYVDVDGGAGQRGLGDRGSRGAGGAAAGRGAGGGAPSVALGARVTISAAGRSRGGSVTRKPVRPPSPHPSGARPPALPPEALPRHVAIVMDGNGRWAKQRGMPRTKGHERGELALYDTVH